MRWPKVPIKDVCTGIYDGPHATPPDSDSGAIFLGIPNFINGRLDLSDIRYISENDFPKWTKRVLPRENDIVFSYEATLNLYAIIPEGFHGCLGRRMALLRIDPAKAYYKFIYYYFYSPAWRSVISENTVLGATVDRIPLVKFPDFQIELPPLDTQRRIADILSAYDDLIENNQKQIKLLEEAAQRLYREWFVELRFPGHETVPVVDGVPEGWERTVFSSKVRIMSGGTPKTDNSGYYGGKIPFYTPKDSDGSFFAFDTITKLTEDGLNNCHSQLYPQNTIIITARGTVGKTTLLAVPMAMNQSCYALASDDIPSQYFLFFALREEIAALQTMANGGVFNTIIVKTFDNIHLLIPPEALIMRFDMKVSSIMDAIKSKTRQNMLLAEARDRLLPKLMSGEVEV